MFVFTVMCESDNPAKALTCIRRVIPVSESSVNSGHIALKTRKMDGWRNSDTAYMNQLEVEGVISNWTRRPR